MSRDGRLGQMQLFGRAGNLSGVGHGQKRSEEAKVEIVRVHLWALRKNPLQACNLTNLAYRS
jgi:hypothetical protein